MPGRSPRRNSAAGWRACCACAPTPHELTGILNGIDESWDPRYCAQLAQPFGAGDWKGKQANADYVRKQFGLAVSRGPIFGLVARLVHQKGVDLVLSAADEIVEAGGQIVVTGKRRARDREALIDAHRRRPDAIGVVSASTTPRRDGFSPAAISP